MADTANACGAALQVLTSAQLFRNITQYQHGTPVAAVMFWRAPVAQASGSAKHYASGRAYFLRNWAKFFTRFSDVRLLDRDEKHQYYRLFRWSRAMPLQFAQISVLAAKRNDPELLQLAVDQRQMWHSCHLLMDALIVNHVPGDHRMLDILETNRIIEWMNHGMNRTYLWRWRVLENVTDLEMLQWLRHRLTKIEWHPRQLVTGAMKRGDLTMLEYIFQTFPDAKWHIKELLAPVGDKPRRLACLRYVLHDHEAKRCSDRAKHKLVGCSIVAVLSQAPLEVLEIIKDEDVLCDAIERAIRCAIKTSDMGVILRFEAAGLISTERRVGLGSCSMTAAALYLVEHGLTKSRVTATTEV